ncbi:MAG TPA: HAD family hydrolase [Terriglobales bacterium]|nr:HAD family hydrolase [Terriglobales bacterium]
MPSAPDAARGPCPALVVLDFDGTLTDAEAHAAAFHASSTRALARFLGGDEAALRRERERERAGLSPLDPAAAWTVNGYGVCPAAADPYLVANQVTRTLIARRRPDLDGRALVAAVLDVHHAAYADAPPPLRPDARDLLEELCGHGWPVRIVTNSRTGIVSALVDGLNLRARDRVRVAGGADKFLVCEASEPDERFEGLPEAVHWPEVGRPVYVRRGRYFDALRGIWEETGVAPAATLVVGDIVELDLAMPAVLGSRVHLVTRSSTMPHEIRLARRLPRSGASPALGAIVERMSERE